MFEEVQERILAHMSPLIKELDLEIYEFTINPHGKAIAVIMLIDHVDGFINIDECSAVNKEIAQLIEDNQLLPDNYTVEVSSPGLDRPLKIERDFKRRIGKKVNFQLLESIENKKEHNGIVKEVTSDKVVIQSKKQLISIPYDKIQRAVQII